MQLYSWVDQHISEVSDKWTQFISEQRQKLLAWVKKTPSGNGFSLNRFLSYLLKYIELTILANVRNLNQAATAQVKFNEGLPGFRTRTIAIYHSR